MKIAVQLFGHVRTFRDCVPYLNKYLLDLYDCDVFFHTWDYENHSDPTWHNNQQQTITKTDEQLLCDLYSPVSYKIETSRAFSAEGVYGTDKGAQVALKGIQSMLYSLSEVNKLRLEYQTLNQCQYDFVIVLRPDVLLLEPLDIDQFAKVFCFSKNASIHFPLQYRSMCLERRFISVPYASDLFFLSKPDTISTIANLYQNFQHYYIDIKPSLPEGVSAPEFSFHSYCLHNSVVPYSYKQYFVVKRDNNQHNLCPKTISLIEIDKLGVNVPKYLIPKKKTYKQIRELVRYWIYKYKCFYKKK